MHEYAVIEGETAELVQEEMNRAADMGYRFVGTVASCQQPNGQSTPSLVVMERAKTGMPKRS